MIISYKREHLKQMELEDAQLILGSETLERYSMVVGPAKTLIIDDKIIGCGGIEPVWRGVGDAWLLLSRYLFEYPIAVGKHCKKMLPEMSRSFHRVQALVLADFVKGVQFVNALGFEYEGIMKSYGPNREDFLRYVILR